MYIAIEESIDNALEPWYKVHSRKEYKKKEQRREEIKKILKL